MAKYPITKNANSLYNSIRIDIKAFSYSKNPKRYVHVLLGYIRPHSSRIQRRCIKSSLQQRQPATEFDTAYSKQRTPLSTQRTVKSQYTPPVFRPSFPIYLPKSALLSGVSPYDNPVCIACASPLQIGVVFFFPEKLRSNINNLNVEKNKP